MFDFKMYFNKEILNVIVVVLQILSVFYLEDHLGYCSENFKL